MVGIEPWATTAALDLALAGIAAIHLVEDPESPGVEEIEAAIATAAPGCAVSRQALSVTPGEPLGVEEGRWDLVIACPPADDLALLFAVARFAHEGGVMSLSAHLAGLESSLGPLVIPRETACWECARRRRLAHADKPRLAHALHAALLRERPARRAHAHLAPAASALGHEIAMAAIEALRAPATSSLRGRIVVRSLADLGTSVHAVLPMPTCDVCGGAAEMSPRRPGKALDPSMSSSELRAALAGVVDARTGIVARLVVGSQDSPHAVDMPVTAHAVLGAYSACALHDHAAEPEDASGKGLTVTQALIGAVGEAVERYSAGRFEHVDIVRAALSEIRGDAIPPADLALYSEAQLSSCDFPYVSVGPDTPIDWALGRWLHTGEAVMVPALTTYYDYPAPEREQFCQVTSNGLAAGPTVEDASLRAVLELVERDAYTLTWLGRLPASRVVLDESVGEGAREVARRLEGDAGEGGRVAVYALEVGLGIPTMMCVVYGDGARWPGASIALSSHLSPGVAVEKAILEQAQAGYYYRRLLEEGSAIPKSADDVRTLVDHALYYIPTSRRGAFSFLDRGREIRASALPEPQEVSLREVVRRVSAAGLRVAVVDVTSPDLLGTPFRVVRAQGPYFQQVHFGHRLARLGNPRLASLAPQGPNPDPHPLD